MSSAASVFTAFLAENYAQFKALVESGSGRRAVKLRMVSDFWSLPKAEKGRLAQLAADPVGQEILQAASKDVDGIPLSVGSFNLFREESTEMESPNVMGVVVRADYSDDEAWTSFVESVLDSEKDMISTIVGEDEAATSGASADQEDATADDSSDSSSASGNNSESSFVFINPSAESSLRHILTGISNLACLRLLNDVDVAKAPISPVASSSLQHRLSNLDGFVECYRGPLLWIYDYRSNADRAARVISQCAESVEAATGDSWRAKASFLPELQLNVSSGAMKVDFGGLDRWDQTERQRNMAEANVSPVA